MSDSIPPEYRNAYEAFMQQMQQAYQQLQAQQLEAQQKREAQQRLEAQQQLKAERRAIANSLTSAILTNNLDKVATIVLDEGNQSANFINEEGLTALTALLIRGSLLPNEQMTDEQQERLLNFFTSQHVNFDVADGNGTLPIFAALYANFPVALKVFNTADVTKVNPLTKVNLLMMAAGLGLEPVIEFIQSEFDLNAKDSAGNTAFHYAIIADRQFPSRMEQSHPREIVSTLCEFGADALIENNEGKTPYDLAVESEQYDLALLLKHCLLPKEGFRKLKIKLNPDAEPSDFWVHTDDTVLEVKQAILFNDARNFNFLFPRFQAHPIMENEREIGDYGMRNGDLVTVMPIIRVGQGGKRRKNHKTHKSKRQAHKRRLTRRN